MFSHIAPAGTPIGIDNLVAGIGGALRPRSAIAALTEQLAELSGRTHVWPISSARAGMSLVLEAMKISRRRTGRDEVIIPGYTCYSVPAAIERAGLRPRLCDVDPATLAIDPAALERCDFSRALAVVSANLYGIPDDLTAIEAICRQQGVYMIDDAAQALGASAAGRPVGQFGDAGLYSFDKGKVISTMQGGAIVSGNGELKDVLDRLTAALPTTTAGAATVLSLQLLVYAAMLRPLPYGFLRRLPGTGLGQTVYETRYAIAQLSPALAGVAASLLKGLADLTADRRTRAGALSEATSGIRGIQSVVVPAQASPAYVRFPIRIPASQVRRHAVAALVEAGIGATTSYPRALIDVPEVLVHLRTPLGDTPGARVVAASIVTLPTHAYSPLDMPARVRGVLSHCMTVTDDLSPPEVPVDA